MLILLALPTIVAVAAMHRYLRSYAPTNLLICHVRAQEPGGVLLRRSVPSRRLCS
jgi:hypothetical protein